MTKDPFGYWPEGQAYRTPPKDAPLLPLCKACGSRHRGATPNCNLPNDRPLEDED